MHRKLVFVTGYFGAPIQEEARRIASCKGWPVLDLDALIEQKDGRSIARLCMMGGEHAYRNAEYEAIEELCGGNQENSEEPTEGYATQSKERSSRAEGVVAACGAEGGSRAEGLVVACGDGILYDDDSRGLILQHELVIAGEDESIESLWENARKEESTYHAFMKFGTEEEKRRKFDAHHERQQKRFAEVRSLT